MRKANQTVAGSNVYRLIGAARMSEHDRRTAINSLRKAEAIVDAIVWVKSKLVALGDFLLKPSLKH